MGGMLNTVFRTIILDDSAYEDWRERPNLFLRGIILIAIVILIAGIIAFAVNLVNLVRAPDLDQIEDQIRMGFEQQFKFNPSMQNLPPEVREMLDQTIEVVIPMAKDLAAVEAPLPRGITGLFQATGEYLTRVFSALGGWMFYGALVLIAVNLLGGAAKLPDFLGTTALYSVPLLLTLLSPIPCLGGLLALIGWIWAIVVYIKAVSVSSDLDAGRSILAVLAPIAFFAVLGLLFSIAVAIWLVIVF
jgi:hypothetical protein